MKICNCYQNQGECWGTRERDKCSCGGDETKCDFYPEKRAASQAIKIITDFKRKEVKHLESEIKTLEGQIKILNGDSKYFNAFQLDEDDFKALIELRKRKIKAIQQAFKIP